MTCEDGVWSYGICGNGNANTTQYPVSVVFPTEHIWVRVPNCGKLLDGILGRNLALWIQGCAGASFIIAVCGKKLLVKVMCKSQWWCLGQWDWSLTQPVSLSLAGVSIPVFTRQSNVFSSVRELSIKMSDHLLEKSFKQPDIARLFLKD